MNVETKEEIVEKINRIHAYWKKSGENANTFSKDLNPDVADLRTWFIARKNSLKIGSLSDETIKIFSECKMDFGVKLLFWNDWAALADEYLKETGKDSIPETAVVEGELKLGRWAKRQIRNLPQLTVSQECKLVEIGLLSKEKVSAWIGQDKQIYYRGKAYRNVSAFARELGISMNKAYLLLDIQKRLDSDNVIKKDVGRGNDMDRNFNKCRFKLTLPNVYRKDGTVNIMFSLQPMPGADGLLIMQECRIVDSLGGIKEQYNIAFDPSTLELSKGQKKITVTFSEKIYQKKSIGMNIEYTILDVKAKKKITVYYEVINDMKKNLMGVNVEDCDIGDIPSIVSDEVLPSDTSNSAEEKLKEKDGMISQLIKEKKELESENTSLKKRIIQQNREIEGLNQKIRELNKANAANKLYVASDMEAHLNKILDYMERTALACGISLSNIYVYTSTKDGKNHVNVRGEIYFAGQTNKLSSGLRIKASLYDANGHIEIEGNYYVSSSFSGYDTFDIGWNGGTKESWLSETKIRVFVVKA